MFHYYEGKPCLNFIIDKKNNDNNKCNFFIEEGEIGGAILSKNYQILGFYRDSKHPKNNNIFIYYFINDFKDFLKDDKNQDKYQLIIKESNNDKGNDNDNNNNNLNNDINKSNNSLNNNSNISERIIKFFDFNNSTNTIFE